MGIELNDFYELRLNKVKQKFDKLRKHKKKGEDFTEKLWIEAIKLTHYF